MSHRTDVAADGATTTGRKASEETSDVTNDGRGRPVVTATGVEKAFGDGDPVLRGVELTLYAGETTVLLGANGTGKSVLLACLAGGLHPSAGDVRVFDDAPADARTRFSFMIQGGLTVGELSGRENAEFYAALHPAATDRWRTLVDTLDLEADALDRPVREYSGGMVRKLELAVTLGADVPLYLLDEPTAELDVTTVDRFHALVADLTDRGRTVVLASHRPRTVRAADRVVYLADGRVVADGDPETLRAAVPPVVAVGGRGDEVRPHLRDGRLFETEHDRRGFLAEGVTPDAVASLGGARLTTATAVDAFNYYVHVAPGSA